MATDARDDASFCLALGGGAARGFAHIPVLEAFDELGITPRAIVGTSIGAILGACYASGMTGREIRVFTLDLLEGLGRLPVITRPVLRNTAAIAILESLGRLFVTAFVVHALAFLFPVFEQPRQGRTTEAGQQQIAN